MKCMKYGQPLLGQYLLKTIAGARFGEAETFANLKLLARKKAA